MGDVMHFTARTLGPDAPHTVVRYGRIDGETVTVDATWTTRRWYWTNQIAITATGMSGPAPEEAAAG